MDPRKDNLPCVNNVAHIGVLWSKADIGTVGFTSEKGERRLEIACKGELEDGNILDLKVLIDTGAEINLIRRGMVPDRLLTRPEKVWKLMAANQQALAGGDEQATLVLQLEGTDVDTGSPSLLLQI